jgi:integrase
MARQPNGRPSIYLGKDGWYHCYLTVGRKPDGRLDRRHLRGQTPAKVLDKIDQLEAKLRIGHVPEVGKSPTLGSWLEHWLTAIAPREVRASTLQGYESKVRHRLMPGVGHLKLSRPVAELAEAIETYFSRLEREVAPATALQIYRILSRALKVAAQRGKIPRNPCELITSPSGGNPDVKPLGATEVRRVLEQARAAGALARWWVALALGLRQGEALGLLWDHVDLDAATPTLTVRWELIRLMWRHGCKSPCGKRPASCPARRDGGLVFEPPKSRRGLRTLPLPDVIAQVLREHRKAIVAARLAAGPRWVKIVGPDGERGGFVFPAPLGGPTNPRDDWGQWKGILVAAQVRTVTRVGKSGAEYVTSTVRVHDARHSAGTTMFAAGMERRELMEWLGHSQISVSARYTHVTPELMAARAEVLNTALGRLVQPDSATTRGA